ncbi:MAG: hypothetical protein ABSF46_33720, partial [Terriglobia bacterium]
MAEEEGWKIRWGFEGAGIAVCGEAEGYGVEAGEVSEGIGFEIAPGVLHGVEFRDVGREVPVRWTQETYCDGADKWERCLRGEEAAGFDFGEAFFQGE